MPGSRSAPTLADPMARVLDVVHGIVVEVSDGRGLGRITPDVSFERELGLGSLERVELATRAARAFGLEPPEALLTVDTPRLMLPHLVAAQTTPAAPGPSPSPLTAPAPDATPPAFASVLDALGYYGREHPDRVHVVLHRDEGRSTFITYGELYRAAQGVAASLRARGLSPRRPVGIMLPTGLAHFAAFLGTLLAGGIPVELRPATRLDRIGDAVVRSAGTLADTAATWLITVERTARMARGLRDRALFFEQILVIDALIDPPSDHPAAALAPPRPDDVALPEVRAGQTEASPERTHARLRADIEALARAAAIGPQDVMVSGLPLHHPAGLIGGWLLPLVQGIPAVLLATEAIHIRPERWLHALAEHRGTCSIVPNVVLERGAAHITDERIAGLDLSHVRCVLLGGLTTTTAAARARFVERLEAAGLPREALMLDGDGAHAWAAIFVNRRPEDVLIKEDRYLPLLELEAAAASVAGVREGGVVALEVRRDSGPAQLVVIAETAPRDARAREVIEQEIADAIFVRAGVPPDHVVLAAPGTVPEASDPDRREHTRRRYLEDTTTDASTPATGLALRQHEVSLVRQLGRQLGRTIYGIYAITVLVSFCVFAALIGRLLPTGRTSRRFAAAEARAALRLAGLRPRITGLHHLPEGAAMITPNHASYLDFLVCTAALPEDPRFVIKAELRDNWLAGPLLARQDQRFIDRHSMARSLADLQQIMAVLRGGESIIVFPEGTFDREVGMRPFKLGAFRLACDARVPVVPVVIRGSRRALRDDTWLPRAHPLELEVLEPIMPQGEALADVVELRDRCAEAIAARLDEPRRLGADIRVSGHEDEDPGVDSGPGG